MVHGRPVRWNRDVCELIEERMLHLSERRQRRPFYANWTSVKRQNQHRRKRYRGPLPLGSLIERPQDLIEAGEVGAPLSPVGRDLGQAVDDGAAPFQELARLAWVADRFEGADLVIAYGEIALPTGVTGVALGQRLGDLQAAAIAIERLLEPALRDQRVAHTIMAGGEVPL